VPPSAATSLSTIDDAEIWLSPTAA
jgi:hypothetical protein